MANRPDFNFKNVKYAYSYFLANTADAAIPIQCFLFFMLHHGLKYAQNVCFNSLIFGHPDTFGYVEKN